MNLNIGILEPAPSILVEATAALTSHQDLRIVAAASTLDSLLEQNCSPHIVVLDLSLTDGSSPSDNIARLREVHTSTLVISTGCQPELIWEASRAGAEAMLRHSEIRTSLPQAVRAIIPGPVAPRPGQPWTTPTSDTALLSKRQAEILALYSSGATAQDVADALYISKNTVLDHLQRIRGKYATAKRPAPTKVDLYRRAVEDGLIPSRI